MSADLYLLGPALFGLPEFYGNVNFVIGSLSQNICCQDGGRPVDVRSANQFEPVDRAMELDDLCGSFCLT